MPLAWAEMRVLLAKLFWSFDISKSGTENEKVEWEGQKVFAVVEKRALEVKVGKRVV